MKISAQQLPNSLKQLAPIYILSGDEPLQMMELSDLISRAAHKAGFSERQTLEVDRSFHWSELEYSANSMSLFASKRLIVLRAYNGLGRDGGAALAAYCSRLPADTILVVQSKKIERQSQNTKWFKSVLQVAVLVEIWEVKAAQLPAWIGNRARQIGLNINKEAVEMLATRVEGNMLAAAQELEKLQLISPNACIDAKAISEQVATSSRYSVYDLIDAALGGGRANLSRALHILTSLKEEGVVAVLVLAAMVYELRTLHHMCYQKQRGASASQYLASVWSSRKNLLADAVSRLDVATCEQLLKTAANIDQINKGVQTGDSWQQLAYIVERLAGLDLKLAH